ncbi:TPM domain-containing protein [Sideroxydans lithotrophicus]|uniref:TPM domain-containing protein n=1 Tax=Sideroxydans lithotrophicus (strain ES-1) TaxID=580332 RepID=D5CS16_SIDLE|nr:YgcG family protein [Sideroxydans lithotrophicus]ADE11752.1 protein of unknown function DUF477 [Sideroxydans lithotrophicus ES-1]
MKRFWTQLILLALLFCSSAQAEVAVPALERRVTDLTGTLDGGQQQLLENRLAAFESGKGSQIAVLMLPSTQPETIEQFGIRVADAWKLGRKGVDDGVLLLVAKDDHRMRIEVGYGLEGALNDATAKRIVSDVISPYFKRGEFYAGIDAGVGAIMKVVEGEPLPPPAPRASARSGGDSGGLGQLIGAGFIIFMIGNILLRQLLGRLPSGLIVGGLIGMLAWVLLLSLAWAIAAAVAAFLFSLLFGVGGPGSSFPAGWGGGSSGGGWGGGGGFGGGDFGGGGGGFGGGGASGDW